LRWVEVVTSLTKQEQTVLWVVLALLLTGLVVKTYRAKHLVPSRPPPAAEEPGRPHSSVGGEVSYADARF
jgi:hypothetical protein